METIEIVQPYLNFNIEVENLTQEFHRKCICSPNPRRSILYAVIYTWLLVFLIYTESVLTLLDPLADYDRMNDSREFGFIYYIEFKNGTRKKVRLSVLLDEREQAELQRSLQIGMTMFAVFPGFLTPAVLLWAYFSERPRHFIWWISWLTAYNIHNLIGLLFDLMKIIASLQYARDFWQYQKKKLVMSQRSLNFIIRETINALKLITLPFSIYIVVVVFLFFRNATKDIPIELLPENQYRRSIASCSSMSRRCSQWSNIVR